MKENKNILFVSQYYPPDVTAAAFRINEMAQILKDDGYIIKILTAIPHKSKIKNNYIKDNSEVLRTPIFKLNRQKTKNYLLHYISFMVNSIFWGIFKLQSKFNYLFATSPPLTVALSGWLLARVKRAKYILDIRDIWPDSAESTGHLTSSSFIYRVSKFLENFVYNKADLITCVSEKMKEYIQNHITKNTPIVVLYNGLFIKFFNINKIKNYNDAMPKNEFMISYIGNIGHAQNLDLLMDAAKLCKNRNIKFILIGEGAVKNILMDKAIVTKLKNVFFKNSCSKKEAFEYMNRSHALLIILKKQSFALNQTIPSKVFDYLWANKPILFGIEGEGKKILSLLPGNLYFDADDPISLLKAITKLESKYSYYKSKADKNRSLVIKNFTREKMTRKLEKYLL
ncbi:MAG: glycosyltransferase family 4 protein [Cellulophaga sp.]